MHKTILFFLLTGLISGCSNKENPVLMTVNGEIHPNEMGITLIHEHIMVDFIGAESTGKHRYNTDEVVERALPYLMEAKESGVNTFFECTPSYLGRDPLLLKELSEKTGINIVTNTGYYGAVQNLFIPQHAYNETKDELAQRWISEFKNGIGESGIKPGFIKIAVSRDDTLSALHEKVVRAAAIAHKETGLAIVSHTGPEAPALAQIELLKEEGVSPEALVWTHAQNGSFEGYLNAALEGAWISLDNMSDNPKRIDWFVQNLKKLKDAGVLNKILISHDAGWYSVGEPNGGEFRGYTSIFNQLIPELEKAGFTKADIQTLLVENPQKAYAVKIRRYLNN